MKEGAPTPSVDEKTKVQVPEGIPTSTPTESSEESWENVNEEFREDLENDPLQNIEANPVDVAETNDEPEAWEQEGVFGAEMAQNAADNYKEALETEKESEEAEKPPVEINEAADPYGVQVFEKAVKAEEAASRNFEEPDPYGNKEFDEKFKEAAEAEHKANAEKAAAEQKANAEKAAADKHAELVNERVAAAQHMLRTEANKTRFDRLKDSAKRRLANMYEAVFTRRGEKQEQRRAKREIAMFQGNINGLVQDSEDLQYKIEDFDQDLKDLDRREKTERADMERNRARGDVSLIEYEQELENIAAEKANILRKREALDAQNQQNARLIEHFESQRDLTSETMARKYQEKIAPLNEIIEGFERNAALLEMQAGMQEADHEMQMMEINKLEERRDERLAQYTRRGMSEKEIAKKVQRLNQQIERGRGRIAQEEHNLKMQIDANAGMLAKHKGIIQPKLDVIDEFKMMHNRSDIELPEVKEAEIARTSPDVSPAAELDSFATEENIPEAEDGTIGDFLEMWNNHIQEKFPDDKAHLTINIDDFLSRTANWSRSYNIKFGRLEKIIEDYYKFKQVDYSNKDAIAGEFKDQLGE